MEPETEQQDSPSSGLRKRRYKAHNLKTRLAAIDFAKQHTNSQAARSFGVDAKSIRDWRKHEDDIRRSVEEGQSKRFRVEGGGRKPKSDYIDQQVFAFFQVCREKKFRVTRNRLKQKAREIYLGMVEENLWQGEEFLASNGWLSRFTKRYDLSLRKLPFESTDMDSDTEIL